MAGAFAKYYHRFDSGENYDCIGSFLPNVLYSFKDTNSFLSN